MQVLRIVTTGIFLALSVTLHAVNAWAQPQKSDIAAVTTDDVAHWFEQPVIDKPVLEPGFRRVLSHGKWVGAVFLTDQINPIPAYSGMPVSVLTALDRNGRIVGVKIHHHQEPILVIGVKPEDLDRFTQQFVGLRATEPIAVGEPRGSNAVDGMTGATITTMVITRSISTSAKVVFAQMQQVAQQEAARAQLAAAKKAAAESIETGHRETAKDDAESSDSRDDMAPLLVPQAVTADPAIADAIMASNEAVRWTSWKERRGAVAVMTVALSVLLSILLFQDWLVQRPALYKRLRLSYLIFTVVVIGGVFSAQLSVINLFAFLQNISHGFSWSTLLIDPVIFLLWAFVAISLLLWGRGVFCGWLCPFGALQELIHKAARYFELPSFTLPPLIHERLWALKYFMLIALLGVSLESFETMATLAEVEPFKTIALGFSRPWYFGLYAVVLLTATAFTSKFYCKYLCVLGAGLSVLGRLRIFDWLHRRSLCGNPCQSCANLCPNGAIKETGEIISHECHYCMDCQVAYWDRNFCQALLPRQRQKQRVQQAPTESEVQIISIERKTQ